MSDIEAQPLVHLLRGDGTSDSYPAGSPQLQRETMKEIAKAYERIKNANEKNNRDMEAPEVSTS